MSKMNEEPPDDQTMERVRIRRRAHWRAQRCGPDRSEVRRIRIRAYYITVLRPRGGNYELPLDDGGRNPRRDA
jgi:hypothetical protein